MSSDALARAREIAAKLSGALMGGGGGGGGGGGMIHSSASTSELGKRKNRWGEDEHEAPGLGSVKRKKLYIPVRDYPDINFLGLLIGPKGITQKQLQDSTGAKIFIRGRGANKDGSSSNTGHPDDNDELHVAIEGSDEAIDRAARQLEQILYNPQEAQKLKSEQLRTLAEMNNAAASAGVETIYGGGSGDSYQLEIRIPNNMVGLVIGKGGDNILRLQAQLNVHAQIAKESEMKPGETQRSIVLKGHIESVNEAKKRIEEIVANQIAKLTGGSRNDDMDHAYVVRLPVPNDKIGIIIGKGGATIKAIQDRTKTTVKIPHDPDVDNPQVRTINIGADSKEALDACQMEIFLTLQMQQQSAQQAYNSIANALNVAVADDRVGIVIGKGGATIKEIQNRLGVKVQIPHGADIGSNPPVRTISIVGPPDAQQMAKYEIEMIAAGHNKDKDKGNHDYNDYSSAAWAANPFLFDPSNPATAALYSAYSAYYDPALLAQLTAAAGVTDPTALAAATAAAAAAASATTAGNSVAETAVPTDPTAYYNDFWVYATYYGEAAARLYYGDWSPPVGTKAPEGYVIPADPPADGVASVTTTQEAVNSESKIESKEEATSAKPDTEGKSNENTSTSAPVAVESAPGESTNADWEAYKKQYTEWWEKYGKAVGADPNPPQM